MTFTGWMNGISGYLNSFVGDNDNNSQQQTTVSETTGAIEDETTTETDDSYPGFDFTLTDPVW